MNQGYPGGRFFARLAARGSRLVCCPRKLRRRELELDTLLELKPAISDLPAVTESVQAAVDLVERKLSYENAAVLTVDRASGRLRPIALGRTRLNGGTLEQDRAHVESKRPRREAGITGWVCRTGEPVLSGDVRQDPRYLPVRDNIRSELCVPIRAEKNVIGVLNVETTRRRAYDRDDLRFLSLVANDLSTVFRAAGAPARIDPLPAGLSMLVPICATCHKCRTDAGDWQRLEAYFMRRDVLFTHGLCPDCSPSGEPE